MFEQSSSLLRSSFFSRYDPCNIVALLLTLLFSRSAPSTVLLIAAFRVYTRLILGLPDKDANGVDPILTPIRGGVQQQISPELLRNDRIGVLEDLKG